ncbi:serine/threonine-protein kinase [Rubripirellula lacrimiformis]|nr:serine/threonine-protein kinase [Rubripirellula lacrimiformis]
MSRLFDKLKIGAASDAGLETPAAVILDDPDPENGMGSSAAWLAETCAFENSSLRPMKFTYSPGSTPLPRYTIRRGIGVGGFGEVYFAVSDAGKEVALKRIQRNLEIELRGVSHCLNLKHPNLVSLFDLCPDDQDQWWIVMEYVAGPNLREVLDDSPDGLPAAEVDRWLTSIASGVEHLHMAGLVHRDLKPGNVFDDMGIPKVGDYGLSKFISTSHRGGHTESVGTFHYMAPEIGRGQYGRQIDIYALGVMLYEMLTGQVPFDGESCHEIIVKHMTAVPDVASIDSRYRPTILRCLEKDPAKRYSTVAEMMSSLGLSTSNQPERTRAVPSDLETPVLASLVQDEADAPVDSEPPFRPEPKVADEPLARAVRHSLDDLNLWWRTLDRSPVGKAVLVLVACFVLLVNTSWLLPLLSVLGVFYVPYYIVRQMVLHVRQQPSYAEAQRIANRAAVDTRGSLKFPMTKAQWRGEMRNVLRAKHSVHRVAELNASWIAAILTTFGLATVAGVVGLHSGPVDATTIAPFGWMAMVVLMSTLAILGMGKLWEREDGEALPRRLVLAGIGAGVGAVAFGLQQFLMIPMDVGLLRDIHETTLPQALYDTNGVPQSSAMMAHFALLFAGLRWWKAVDPLRRTRLSFWAVAVAVVGEWAVHQILPVPQPAGMMVAGGIAIAIQMAAPWISPRNPRQPELVRTNQPSAQPESRSMA